jgi:hypothetical protein
MRASRGESETHRRLKREACQWLFRAGYRAIAAEVNLFPLGIIDAVGVGTFGPYQSHLRDGRERPQTCFIEAKASRADFLRDLTEDHQLELALFERRANRRRRGRRTLRQRVGLGKFDACLLQPMANLHYVLCPSGLLKRDEIPHRWGLLVLGETGITVAKAPVWQEAGSSITSSHQTSPSIKSALNNGSSVTTRAYVESAIARTLTSDIYRADDRAMASVNREILTKQARLADRIRETAKQFEEWSAHPEKPAG